MALIDCYECGKQISDAAPSCPSCGAPKIDYALPANWDEMTSDEQTGFCIDKACKDGETEIGGVLKQLRRMPKCPLCGGILTPMNPIEGASKRNRCGGCGHMA